MKYLQTIEELSKSKNLHEGNIDEFSQEIIGKVAKTLNCCRCNAWIFENNHSQLTSLFSYYLKNNEFTSEKPLTRDELPVYFNFLERNEFVVSNNAQKEKYNAELLHNYLLPHKITSMIDVPLRSEGKMIGVICFEHTGSMHKWTSREQSFTLSVAQLLSLAFEIKDKKKYRENLEENIIQKEILLAEINHRVKNNMAIILSLLNIQKSKVQDDLHLQLFNEISDKVYSIAAVQEQLHTSDEVNKVDLGMYISKLTQNLLTSYDQERSICFDMELDNVNLDVSKAIPCGLIINEALTNCFKYAFDEKNLFPKLFISLKKVQNQVQIIVQDNGAGFDTSIKRNGMGLELINGLADQLDGEIELTIDDGVEVKLSFTID